MDCSSLLYSSESSYTSSSSSDPNSYSQFRVLDERLFQGASHLVQQSDEHVFSWSFLHQIFRVYNI